MKIRVTITEDVIKRATPRDAKKGPIATAVKDVFRSALEIGPDVLKINEDYSIHHGLTRWMNVYNELASKDEEPEIYILQAEQPIKIKNKRAGRFESKGNERLKFIDSTQAVLVVDLTQAFPGKTQEEAEAIIGKSKNCEVWAGPVELPKPKPILVSADNVRRITEKANNEKRTIERVLDEILNGYFEG